MLDLILSESKKSVSHILDDRYDGMLSDDEKSLQAMLRNLRKAATPAIRTLPAWKPVEEVFGALGGDNDIMTRPRVSRRDG